MDLLSEIKKLVAEERWITVALLRLLARAEREKLYAERGYSSIYEFCVKELGYSEGAAARRVGAMRLMRKNEGVEEKIGTGALSVTVASKLETAFRKTEMPSPQRADLIKSAEGLTAREAEKKLVEILPSIKAPQREITPIGSSESLLKIVVDRSLKGRLDQLRALYSHRKPGVSYRELIEILVEDVLKKKTHCNTAGGEALRYISPALKTKIRERDGGRCTYQDPLTKRRCEARNLLEFDHITPVAHGGRATESNLRLLCRTHNQLAAEKVGLTFSTRTNPGSGKPAAR
jgi:hypothetical protein